MYALGKRRIEIRDFAYDGAGPDAFFWAGARTAAPSDDGVILPFPFDGKFFHYTDRVSKDTVLKVILEVCSLF